MTISKMYGMVLGNLTQERKTKINDDKQNVWYGIGQSNTGEED